MHSWPAHQQPVGRVVLLKVYAGLQAVTQVNRLDGLQLPPAAGVTTTLARLVRHLPHVIAGTEQAEDDAHELQLPDGAREPCQWASWASLALVGVAPARPEAKVLAASVWLKLMRALKEVEAVPELAAGGGGRVKRGRTGERTELGRAGWLGH
jgi:hypothetical protein